MSESSIERFSGHLRSAYVDHCQLKTLGLPLLASIIAPLGGTFLVSATSTVSRKTPILRNKTHSTQTVPLRFSSLIGLLHFAAFGINYLPAIMRRETEQTFFSHL